MIRHKPTESGARLYKIRHLMPLPPGKRREDAGNWAFLHGSPFKWRNFKNFGREFRKIGRCGDVSAWGRCRKRRKVGSGYFGGARLPASLQDRNFLVVTGSRGRSPH